MATVSSIKERVYVTKETVFGAAIAPVNADAVRFISCTITPVQNEIPRPDKNLDEDEPIGMSGRRSCTWTLSMSQASSGVAGNPPDCGDLLETAFGKAVVSSAGVSCTYGLGALKQSLNIWKYCETGLAQVVLGGIVQSLKVSLGGDVPTIEFSGEGIWAYDNAQAADGTTEVAAKGGLGTWPAEPTAPTTNGIPPSGFSGIVTLDSEVYSTLLTSTITLSTGRQLPKDGLNKYPTDPVASLRTVGHDFGVKEDDSAKLIGLMQKSHSKLPLDTTIQIGKIAGNQWAWTTKNMPLNAPAPDSSQPQRHVTFSGNKAHPTAAGSYDALGLVIT
jgi:hypothetical protein